VRPEQRQRVEALVETLLAILDADDGDPDLELDHDAEDDPAEWGVADTGGADEYQAQLWFKQLFEEHRQAQRLAAMRAAITMTVD
jgi:hypothetical protein